MRRIALAGGTIYADPDAEPIHEGAVLVEGSHIAAAGARQALPLENVDETLDCSGCTIVSGFWNSHVHFFERKWADAAQIPADELQHQMEETFTRFGFTTVFDTGSMWENTRAIRDRIDTGEIAGPRIFSTGEALVPPNALPPAAVLAALGYVDFPAPEISDAAQAADAAAQLLAGGVDGIKIFPSAPRGGSIARDAIAAAAGAARAAGKPAFAHPDTADDIRAALAGGVNVIAHTTPRSGPWDEALVSEMREGGVALTPTLALWKTLFRHDRHSLQDRLVDTALEQLRIWHAAGGRVLFGTDVGAADPDPREEYELMARAGMDVRAILASLTTEPSRHFAASNRRGRIAPGLDADIAVLRGDLSNGVRVLCDVRCVLRAGAIVYRSG